MDPLGKLREQPELHVRTKFIELMTLRGWFTHITHGNRHSNGLPDIYAAHLNWGQRWLEVKNADAYHFTSHQLRVFPKIVAKGVGIWIVALPCSFSEQQIENEYKMICNEPPNWTKYLKHSKRPY